VYVIDNSRKQTKILYHFLHGNWITSSFPLKRDWARCFIAWWIVWMTLNT